MSRMNLPAKLLWFNAAVFAALGAGFILAPQLYFYTIAGPSFEDPAALSSIRVAYGGMALAMGLQFGYCASHPDTVRVGLIGSILALCAATGAGLVSYFVGETSCPFMYLLLGAESLFVAIFFAESRQIRLSKGVRELIDSLLAPRLVSGSRQWVYLAATILPSFLLLLSLLGKWPGGWWFLLAVELSLLQIWQPTVIGWSGIFAAYTVVFGAALLDVVTQLSDYGSEDHSAFEGWGTVAYSGGFALVIGLLLVLLAWSFPKRTQ